MGLEHILIPLAPDSRDLKGLHHAVSLAERIDSQIIVFFFEPESGSGKAKSPVIEACEDVIHRVQESGLKISLLISSSRGDEAEAEILKLLARERIDLIVISDTETQIEKMIIKIMPLISCQVVRVKGKNNTKLEG